MRTALDSELHPRITAATFGQSDPASIDAMVAGVAAQHGTVDEIVNNAAAFGKEHFEELDAAEWDRVHAVILKGVGFCCKLALSVMVPRGTGTVIDISSITATRMVH